MSVQHMRVAAAAAVLALSAAGYADDAEQANPDSRALLEYVKKLEARVDQLEQEKQWPLEQLRSQSGSALENAVRSVNISGYMEFQYGYNLRHGGGGDGGLPSAFSSAYGGGGGGDEKKAAPLVPATVALGRGDTLAYNALADSSNDDNGFSFQNVQLLVDKPLTTADSTGFRVRAEYGDVSIFDNRDPNFDAGGQAFSVREAYMSWRMNSNWGATNYIDLSVGKFDSPLGFETPDNTDNWLVTRNNIFNLATPRTHTGLRAMFPWMECQKTTFYVVNGWDNVRDAGDGKTLIVSHKMGNYEWMNSTVTLNGSYGNEGGGFYPGFSSSGGVPVAPDGNKVKLAEVIWQGEIDADNKVAVDALWSTADKGAVDGLGDAEQADTHGASAYLRHQWTKTSWIAARAGWFCTTLAKASDLRVYDLSLAAGWDLAADLSLVLEFRHDHSPTNRPFQGRTADSFMSSQDRVTASMVYRF